jgi:hypothetical protein
MEFGGLSGHLGAMAKRARNLLGSISAEEWGQPYAGSSSWTRGELLGHLIDSAINNQQRFARALIEEDLRFPSYAQNEMVRVQRYREAPVGLLIDLWSNLNGYIAHLLRQVPPSKLGTRCVIGEYPEMTLAQLALDYVAHLEHHLKQLAGNDALEYSDLTWPPVDRWKLETKTSPRE